MMNKRKSRQQQLLLLLLLGFISRFSTASPTPPPTTSTGEEGSTNARNTRTLGSFFSSSSASQPSAAAQSNKQQQVLLQQQQQQYYDYYNNYNYGAVTPGGVGIRPLVYQVKYYDFNTKNNIDKAGGVGVTVGPAHEQQGVHAHRPVVYYYTPADAQVVPGNVQVQPQQQQAVVQGQSQQQGYVYVNPVVGGGQTYVIGQVGNQQVLIPCPVDYPQVSNTQVFSTEQQKVVVNKPAVVQPQNVVVDNSGVGGNKVVYTPTTTTVRHGSAGGVVSGVVRPVGVGVGVGVVGYGGGAGGGVPVSVVGQQQQQQQQQADYFYGNQQQYGQQYGVGGYYVNPYYSPVNPPSSSYYYYGVNPSSSYYYQPGYETQQSVVNQVNVQSPQNAGVSGVQVPVASAPYVYVYSPGGGSPYNSVYPYVVQVRPSGKDQVVPVVPVVGSSTNRVSVSAQGQRISQQQQVPVQQQNDNNKQQEKP